MNTLSYDRIFKCSHKKNEDIIYDGQNIQTQNMIKAKKCSYLLCNDFDILNIGTKDKKIVKMY